MSSVAIGIYWGARRESVEECASRAVRHFAAIGSVSPNLARWFEKAWSADTATTPFDATSISAVMAALLQDLEGGTTAPEHGFIVDVWNSGAGGWSASATIACGASAPACNNSVLLKIDFGTTEVLPFDALLNLLQQFVAIWQPQSGKIFRTVRAKTARNGMVTTEEAVFGEYLRRREGLFGRVRRHVRRIEAPDGAIFVYSVRTEY